MNLDAAEREPEDQPEIITLGNLTLNLSSFRLTLDGELVDLTYHEMELLRLLFAQPGRIISYAALAEALWDNSTHSSIRHLNVLVHRLRMKLAGAQPYVIETVRGRGYGLLLAREAERSAS